jgi:hypothetical protein
VIHESINDERTARWLERVIQALPVEPRPEGYNSLGRENLDPNCVARLGRTGKDCFEAIRRRDAQALGTMKMKLIGGLACKGAELLRQEVGRASPRALFRRCLGSRGRSPYRPAGRLYLQQRRPLQ